MTTAELIERLRDMPQDQQVVAEICNDAWYAAGLVDLKEVRQAKGGQYVSIQLH